MLLIISTSSCQKRESLFSKCRTEKVSLFMLHETLIGGAVPRRCIELQPIKTVFYAKPCNQDTSEIWTLVLEHQNELSTPKGSVIGSDETAHFRNALNNAVLTVFGEQRVLDRQTSQLSRHRHPTSSYRRLRPSSTPWQFSYFDPAIDCGDSATLYSLFCGIPDGDLKSDHE